MSTESISEVGDLSQDVELVHTYCMESPRNYPNITTCCCGTPPKGQDEEVDPSVPTSCPMCADLEEETSLICACWW
jgi:hypothetical protein